MSSQGFRGPFGFWPFPLLNLLLGGLAGRQGIAGATRPLLSNEETITWTDYKGNQRSMTIHRRVESR